MSGAVFEWYTSNTKVAFPFTERQSDSIHELFVDAYVMHNKHRTKNSDVRIRNFDPSGELLLKFGDGTTLSTLTASDGFSSSVFGRFTVYQWHKHTTLGAGFTDEDTIARLVVLTSALSAFTFPLVPANGSLLSSVVNPRVSRVRRIGLALPLSPHVPVTDFAGELVRLDAGNNMRIAQTDEQNLIGLGLSEADDVRPGTNIVFDAVAGYGEGRYVDCDSTVPPIKLINDVGPADNGNFQLEGRGCIWAERPLDSKTSPVRQYTDYLATMLDNRLKLHQDCKACCDCEDYEDAYNAIAVWWATAKMLAQRIELYRQQFNVLAAELEAQKVAREDGLNVYLQVIARPDFHLALSALVYNNSSSDLSLVTVTFDLKETGFVYTPRSGMLDAEYLHGVQMDPVEAGTELEISIPELRATKWASYSLEVRFGPLTLNRADLELRPEVTVVSGAQTVTDTRSVKLKRPLEKS